MFKKRNVKAPTRKREPEEEEPEELDPSLSKEEAAEGDTQLAIEDLIALRKFRKSRQGIDAAKLNQGDVKKRRKRGDAEIEEESTPHGLQKPKDADDDEPEDEEAKARKLVRSNNFTQQTNKLDVDKHMMAYIEDNLRALRGETSNPEKSKEEVYDPHAELFRVDDKYKSIKKESEEGNVTNSMAMLTAIPEVDLGMDVRLKNIEETEKAKRMIADNKKEKRSQGDDEGHLASARFYRPHQQAHSDNDALKNAKLEAMGLPPEHEPRRNKDRKDVATDDVVMERFKKRMRR
ncbi:hypothetical protein FRC03_006941 [Tulasnella sp. 419]|nr:hypothetical protein FRC03_006941 [Tulasnella sp. 419]